MFEKQVEQQIDGEVRRSAVEGRIFLTDDNIVHSSEYRDGDSEAYDSLLKALQVRNFYIEDARGRILEKMPTFEGFGWRADDRRVRSLADGSVSAAQITHQGIHTLIAGRFGEGLRGRPLMTLLNEAAGLGLGAYFSVCHIKKNGRKPRSFFHHRLEKYAESAELLGVSFDEALKEFLEFPYGGFQRATEDAYFTLRECFLHLRRLKNREEFASSWSRLLGVIGNRPFYLFSHRYSLSVPAHYVAAYCGLDSSDEDQTQVQDFLNILRGSGSLVEFLDNVDSGRRLPVAPKTVLASSNSAVTPGSPILGSRRFDREYLVDSDGLLDADGPLVQLLFKDMESKEISVTSEKTESIYKLGKQCFNTLPWFLLDSSLSLDVKGTKISSSQFIRLSGGRFVCDRVGGNRWGMPWATLLVYTFSRQLVLYCKVLADGIPKVAAFERFRHGCQSEFQVGQMLLGHSCKMAREEFVSDESVLDICALPGADRILKSRDLAQEVLSIAAHCGYESSPEDHMGEKRFFETLNSAGSMFEFLSRL